MFLNNCKYGSKQSTEDVYKFGIPELFSKIKVQNKHLFTNKIYSMSFEEYNNLSFWYTYYKRLHFPRQINCYMKTITQLFSPEIVR